MAEDKETRSSPRPEDGLLRRFAALPLDSPIKTVAVALVVCLVCSIVVSAATMLLRPRQLANQARERNRHIVEILKGVPGLAELVGDAADSLEAHVVDLETGAYAESIDPAAYDQRQASTDPERSIALPRERDLAGLGRRARWATVYLVREGGSLRLIILPVSGQGFASVLYGYLALDGDAATIRALSFYEQGETPGLGAQIQDPRWQAQWRGRRIRDTGGAIRVRVAKGAATSEYEVDGISGATYTGAGVTTLLHFWLGPDGFEPFLRRIAGEGNR